MKDTAIIYFMGMDGSGKSTLSSYLYSELKVRSYNVERVWWLEHENSVLRKVLRRLGRTVLGSGQRKNDSKSFGRRTDRLILKFFRALYPRLVLFDYMLFGLRKVWIPKKTGKKKILIFDRYIYDVISSLSREFGFAEPTKVALFRWFRKVLPVPDKIFLIDILPEIAFARKKEEFRSMKDAQALWGFHQDLFRLVDRLVPGRSVIIDNTGDIESIKKGILEDALSLVDGEGSQ
ncbi:MAG: dTMP kinase [Halobacteriota archaeon]